jgi:hypothetical protein
MRTLLGADWEPAEVLLPRASPADAEPYRRHLRAPVRFNQEIATLVLPANSPRMRRVLRWQGELLFVQHGLCGRCDCICGS